jgi:hypothetical protein
MKRPAWQQLPYVHVVFGGPPPVGGAAGLDLGSGD